MKTAFLFFCSFIFVTLNTYAENACPLFLAGGYQAVDMISSPITTMSIIPVGYNEDDEAVTVEASKAKTQAYFLVTGAFLTSSIVIYPDATGETYFAQFLGDVDNSSRPIFSSKNYEGMTGIKKPKIVCNGDNVTIFMPTIEQAATKGGRIRAFTLSKKENSESQINLEISAYLYDDNNQPVKKIAKAESYIFEPIEAVE